MSVLAVAICAAIGSLIGLVLRLRFPPNKSALEGE